MPISYVKPIGIIRSPYKEKFSVPRQPNLASAGKGELHLLAPYNDPCSIRGLEQFSHLWIIFLFNLIKNENTPLTVRPPRLGGNKSLGVFATRSPFRPNHIGLSSVELKEIIVDKKQVILQLGGVDLVDGTPVIDIKPYLPYCDSYPNATAGYAQDAPLQLFDVEFTNEALERVNAFEAIQPKLKLLIIQVLSQDPRPAYKKNRPDRQIYGVQLYQFNIKWKVDEQKIIVFAIEVNNSK